MIFKIPQGEHCNAVSRNRVGKIDQRTAWTLLALVVLGGIAVYLWMPRLSLYPKVTHLEADKLMRQLYTACSSKDEQRLAAAHERFQKLIEADTISLAERKVFEKIFKTAQTGSWEKAATECLRFAQDQVYR
ncbi:MAG TPA: hypothetical protein PKD64_01460 [Pirellulaceae bacterium]|nr:hypothetical protein [Pirellulaceae bacterium]HMO90838.1 hypothetical protein [Pirellulaceae bacterium]HMP68686.1 hypothetical protein [Pirellulaceae bacterium]